MSTDYSARVARGAALLDRIRPSWAREIKLDVFDMGLCSKCVLGQLYGLYDDGLDALGLISGDRAEYIYGFNSSSLTQMASYAALTTAWRAEIRKRLEATT
jgi:hypothetical protein